MGPNGTGKSTLAYAIMGHPRYEISGGDVLVNGESILGLSSDERAHKGIFLAFQYPVSIPGVSLANFLRVAVNARNKALNPEDKGISVVKFRQSPNPRWTCSKWITNSRALPERRLFRGRENAPKFCRWLCWNPLRDSGRNRPGLDIDAHALFLRV